MIDKNETGYVPPFINGKSIIIRGTEEWDERERARRAIGCSCMSFGSIPPPHLQARSWGPGH